MRFTKRFNEEDASVYVAHMESEFNYISQAIEVIKEVAVKFDGKVHNARFWRAINDALGKKIGTRVLSYDDGTKSDPINIVSFNQYPTRASAKFSLFDRGFALPSRRDTAIYIDADISYTVYLFLEDIVTDNRISAEKVRTALDEFNNEKQRTLAKYQDALKNWDLYEKEVHEVNAYIRECIAKINPLFIDETAKNLDGYNIHFMAKEF